MDIRLVLSIVVIGSGATAVVDLWALLRRRILRQPLPDWGLVGRWFGHLARGRVRHHSIASTAPIRHETLIGWIAHYAIGTAFATILTAAGGRSWIENPTLLPALALGLVSVAGPFLILQPGMGAGVAACRTRNPNGARIQSLTTHALFGLGLYLSASLLGCLNRDLPVHSTIVLY